MSQFTPKSDGEVFLSLSDISVGFGSRTILENLSFDVKKGSIFALMGASGSGKSTVLKSLIGLNPPLKGKVAVDGEDYWAATEGRRAEIDRRFGVLFQSAALWTAMTVGENVALPLQMFTKLKGPAIRRFVKLKLSLVGLEKAVDLQPSELSGGMRKRAGLARALALDPDVLFFDEPSSGLDPISSKRMDDLILNLRDGLGATVVLVSHELPSLFSIADDGVFLDPVTRTAIAHGSPADMRDNSLNPLVRAFMHRERVAASVDQKDPQHERQ